MLIMFIPIAEELYNFFKMKISEFESNALVYHKEYTEPLLNSRGTSSKGNC